jgi:hypothetical protein
MPMSTTAMTTRITRKAMPIVRVSLDLEGLIPESYLEILF